MSPDIATLYRPSPMWKWATAEPRIWPAFWNVSRTSGAMSVVSPYFSGIVFATALRMLLESYADLRASPIATLMKSSWRRDIRSRVGGVAYTGPSYPYLYRAGISPLWSRWAWVTTTASIELRGVTSGAFRYGDPLSSEIRTPQSTRIFDSFVLMRVADRPTCRYPPRDVSRTQFSPAGTSRASRRPTCFKNVCRSSWIVRRYARMSSTVFDGIGGGPATFGAHPVFFLISLRRGPCFPITRPGGRGSVWTPPAPCSQEMFVVLASFRVK